MHTEPPQSNEQSDLELVGLAKHDDARAFTTLLDRYLPFLHSRAGRYSNIVGVETEDFVQEGMLALYRAVKGFDSRTGLQFSTYAFTCINNSMSSAIKVHMKNLQQNTGVNLDAFDEGQLHQQTKLLPADMPVEDIFINMETTSLRARQIEALLSHFEQQVLKLYLGGHSYQQIAHVLRTTTKAVDNALQRVRRKLRPEF